MLRTPRHAVRSFAMALVSAAILSGCAGPGSRGGASADGPERTPPPDLLKVPDAEPKIEPIRSGGANKPYTVWGQDYVPLPPDAPLRERGLASWYGRKFAGKPTASGELYDMYAMTAAHPTLPIPSYARIRNPANGREVVVRINDRGPFKSSRIVDVSYTAALKLDILRGASPVELERITSDEIRSGAWRHAPAPVLAAPGPVAAAPAPVAATTDAAAARSAPGVMPRGVIAASPGSAAAPSESVAPPPATAGSPSGPATAPAAVFNGPLAGDTAAPAPVLPASATGDVDPRLAPAAPALPVDDGAPARAGTAAGRGFWVQLGAFREHDGALDFRRQVEVRVQGIAPLLTVFGDATLFRLQAGPYASRDAARDAAERLRTALKLVPVIVERR